MKIIIIGAGFTGVQLARKLLAERHRVVLIDRDAERVRDIGNQLDCTVIHSEGNSLEVLEKAGLASADVLVAVAAEDEVNMIACSLADAMHPRVLKVARVRSYAYYSDMAAVTRKFAERLPAPNRPPFGIDWLVNPDVEAAKAVVSTLAHGAVGDVVELDNDYGIVTLTLGKNSPLIGLPLSRVSTIKNWHYLVAHVERASAASLPTGETVFEAADRIGVLVKLDEIAAVAAVCDSAGAAVSRVVVVGAGRIGRLVVDELLPRGGVRVDVVDPAAERCQALVEAVRGVQVFCGDATDEHLVREEGLDACDLAVAVSGNYDRNLISAAYLKSRGVRRAIALTDNADVAEMAHKLGVDVAISMHETVVDSIMSHLRGANVSGVHTVCGGAFEIVSCQVGASAKACGKMLRDLAIGGAGLVLMVRQADGTRKVPRGDTVIAPGETVVLIVPAGNSRVVTTFAG